MQSLISFFARYKEQYRQNLILALPVVLTQLGQIFTQVVDNLMVGLSPNRLQQYRLAGRYL